MDNSDFLCVRNRCLYVCRLSPWDHIQTQAVAEVRATIVYLVYDFIAYRSFAMAAAMFMNSNSLPIALMQSLVITVPGLKWGDDDNQNAMLGRALSYLVMYSTLGMVVRHTTRGWLPLDYADGIPSYVGVLA